MTYQFNPWDRLGVDLIISILSYCRPDNIISFAVTCHDLREIALSWKAIQIWNITPFKACVNRSCWCGRFKYKENYVRRIISTVKFKSVEICGPLNSLGLFLKSFAAQKTIKTFVYSLVGMEILSKDVDILLPPDIVASDFESLTSFTLNSSVSSHITQESAFKLLSLIGNSLTHLSFWPSSPLFINRALCDDCSNLKSLRLESYVNDKSPFILPLLEELIWSYPKNKYSSATSVHIPNLKKIVASGVIDDSNTLIQSFKILPRDLRELEIGDSSSCASNEVIRSIASSFPVLQSLTIKSDNQAHSLTASTMITLYEGCPKLTQLDLSGALVWFDTGSFEAIGNFKHLSHLCTSFSIHITRSLKSVLTQSTSLKEVIFILQCDEDDEKILANREKLKLSRDFPHVTFIIEDS